MVNEYDFILELKHIQGELNHIFERILGQERGHQFFSPGINIQIADDNVRIVIDIPGIGRDDLAIYMSGSNLVIEGKKNIPATYQKVRPIRLEREFGPFYRAVTIPYAVNNRHAHACYRDGFIVIDLPRIEDRRQKRINIPVDFGDDSDCQ